MIICSMYIKGMINIFPVHQHNNCFSKPPYREIAKVKVTKYHMNMQLHPFLNYDTESKRQIFKIICRSA